jgi:hypothetical protein
MGVSRDTGESGTNFADILSNALPPSSLDKSKEKSSDSSNGSSEVSESASTSSLGSNSSHSKAPGSQLAHKSLPFNRHLPLGVELNNKLLAIEKDPSLDVLEREKLKQSLRFPFGGISQPSFFGSGNDTVGSVVGELCCP